MSRTYNTKHDFNKACGVIEHPNGFEKEYPYGVETREPGIEYKTDLSFSTFSDDYNPHTKCTRHPNKKHKKGALTREFHTLGVSDPSKWKNRFGDVYDKSNRNHLIRSIIAHKRRHKFKEQTRKLVEESI